MSLHGNTYCVDPLLAGTKIELVYDPFDLTGPVAVTAAGGVPAGEAVLLQIGRHVHPKAANAAAEADAGAANAASGIDYLRMIQTRHHDALGGAGISFDTVTNSKGRTHTAPTDNAAIPDGDDPGSQEATR